MLSAYESELRVKGLNDFYDVKTDEAGYKKVVGPVEGLRSISITFMIIVLNLGSIILILLSSFAIRERKYKIGVLRAMGMKKRKVAFGLWMESLIITIMCLCIGLGAGAFIVCNLQINPNIIILIIFDNLYSYPWYSTTDPAFLISSIISIFYHLWILYHVIVDIL